MTIANRLFVAHLCGLAAMSAMPAQAAPPVALNNTVFVETVGADTRSLAPARRLSRGDRVIYVTSWRRAGGGSFLLTYPLPRDVAYQGSANADEEVSADGGRTWGKLGVLRLGARLALPEDVTHIRWRVTPAVAAKGKGRIAWSAIVR